MRGASEPNHVDIVRILPHTCTERLAPRNDEVLLISSPTDRAQKNLAFAGKDLRYVALWKCVASEWYDQWSTFSVIACPSSEFDAYCKVYERGGESLPRSLF